jgi:hypothetical protein
MEPSPRRRSRSWRTFVVLAFLAAASSIVGLAAWLVVQPLWRDLRVSGDWSGEGWGKVTLERKGHGRLEGTCTSVYGEAAGRIEVRWNPRSARYEGTWGEGRFRFGFLEFAFDPRERRVRGLWGAAADCERSPGEPASAAIEWSRPSASPPPRAPLAPRWRELPGAAGKPRLSHWRSFSAGGSSEAFTDGGDSAERPAGDVGHSIHP